MIMGRGGAYLLGVVVDFVLSFNLRRLKCSKLPSVGALTKDVLVSWHKSQMSSRATCKPYFGQIQESKSGFYLIVH